MRSLHSLVDLRGRHLGARRPQAAFELTLFAEPRVQCAAAKYNKLLETSAIFIALAAPCAANGWLIHLQVFEFKSCWALMVPARYDWPVPAFRHQEACHTGSHFALLTNQPHR